MDINDGERTSVLARRKKVYECFKRLGITTNKEDVPVVAVLGSGGGLRAMVGFLGVLAELASQDLLDTVMYICGVSGSTWCLSTLYNNDNWSTSMNEMERTMCKKLCSDNLALEKSWEKLKQMENIESITDFWAYVVIPIMTKEINGKRLSDHRAACETGTNPYPVYAAVERENVYSGIRNKPETWFEFTPHKVGFPAFKQLVDTELLGSQFSEGKPLKVKPERDLCYLQGLWGSAIANKEGLLDIHKGRIIDLLSKAQHLTNVSDLFKCEKCDSLQALLTESLRNQWKELLSTLIQLTDGGCEMCKIIHSLLIFLKNWEWGTTPNFLCNPNDLDGATNDIFKKEYLHLIDAGLEINTAYPLMLTPHRKVDLILSFDFSQGGPFKTLIDTKEYCAKNNIPFPEVDIKKFEENIPSENCYIFEDDKKGIPTVMHFPLFNRKNCRDNVQDWSKRYSTNTLVYANKDVEDLLQVSKENVNLNRNLILEKLQKSALKV